MRDLEKQNKIQMIIFGISFDHELKEVGRIHQRPSSSCAVLGVATGKGSPHNLLPALYTLLSHANNAVTRPMLPFPSLLCPPTNQFYKTAFQLSTH